MFFRVLCIDSFFLPLYTKKKYILELAMKEKNEEINGSQRVGWVETDIYISEEIVPELLSERLLLSR